MKYKIIFLIISSKNEYVYDQMRQLIPLYMNLYSNQIQYFFIESCGSQEEEVIEKNHFLFCKGIESFYPGIFEKSVKSIDYVNQHYSYDFIVRTNLSTFWHMDHLLKWIENIPTTNYAGGFYGLPDHLSGTGIILSRDVANLLIPHLRDLDVTRSYDDVAISRILWSENIVIHQINDDERKFYIDGKLDNPNDDFSKVLHFRVKNSDRSLDIQIFRNLLKRVYNIEAIPI